MSEQISRIKADADCVTLINVFTVEAKDQARLVEVLVDATDAVMSKMPGFISASIHKGADGVRVTNYAQWHSAKDFQAMLANPEAQKHMTPISEFATCDAQLYSVVDVHHVWDNRIAEAV